MNLYFMRHGIAVPRDAHEIHTDRERPLSPKGLKKMRRAAEGLLTLKLSFDRILTSPLLRAQQTAQVVAEVFNTEDRIEEIPELAPESSIQKLLSSLAAYRESKRLLFVGHQPLLGEIASFLLSGEKGLEMDFKKGGICCIEVDSLPPKKALFRWLLTPKQLRLLGGQ